MSSTLVLLLLLALIALSQGQNQRISGKLPLDRHYTDKKLSQRMDEIKLNKRDEPRAPGTGNGDDVSCHKYMESRYVCRELRLIGERYDVRVDTILFEFQSTDRSILIQLMAISVLPDSYPNLIESLKKDLPKSFMVYHAIKNLMQGRMKDKMVWVDKWPQFTSLVVSEEKLEKSSPRMTAIYCRGAEFAKSLDKIIRHISSRSQETLAVYGGTHEVIDAIKQLYMRDEEQSSNQDPKVVVYTTVKVYSVSKENLIKPPVPSGITVSRLTLAETETVYHAWEHGNFMTDAKEFIENLISTQYTVCLFNEDGKPVAWGLEYQYGPIGMVNVIPEYRKRGLGSLVISLLAEKILETEDFVFSLIEIDNNASFAMHEKVGYQNDPKFPESPVLLYHFVN